MARPTRLILILGSLIAIAFPSTSEAGLIPWAYDAVFGPVGSMRYRTAYAPYYGGGYGSGGYGAMYGNYSAMSYAPASYAPSVYGSSGGGGCSSCGQSSYYAPTAGYVSDSYVPQANYVVGASNYVTPACSTCQSGNCSTGNCTNCSANMPPIPANPATGSNYVGAPIPDPNNTKGTQTEIQELRNKILRDEHRWNEVYKFLKKHHPNDFAPTEADPQTYETVPPRRRTDSFNSQSNPERFDRPRGPAPSSPVEDEERRKEVISIPESLNQKDGEKSESEFKEAEPQTLRLDDRSTSIAVAPRERMRIMTNQSKTAVAKSVKPQVKTSDDVRLPELVRK